MTAGEVRSSDEDEPRSPWARPGFVIAAAFVGLLVVLGAWLLATGGEQDAATPGTTATEGQPTAPADDSASVCGLAPGAQEVPQSAPPLSWQVLAGVGVPSSPTAGPGEVDGDGVRWCYERSPWGAVLAAANFLAAQFDYDRLPGTLARSAVPGEHRDATVATFEGLTEQEYAQGIAASRVEVVGFRVPAYDGDTAVIDLLARNPAGQRLAVPVVAVWSEGDWKIDMAATEHSGWTLVTDATGFVTWEVG